MLSDLSNNISTGFVVFNLVIMCMPYAGQPESWSMFVEGLSSFVTWVFIVEMLLKQLGMGCTAYWSDSWNTLDGVIVSLSIIEMLITIFLADTGINISFLRMLRLLRLLRLLTRLEAFRTMAATFLALLPAASRLLKAFLVLVFIFASVGMHLFGGIITTDRASGAIISRQQAHARASLLAHARAPFASARARARRSPAVAMRRAGRVRGRRTRSPSPTLARRATGRTTSTTCRAA